MARDEANLIGDNGGVEPRIDFDIDEFLSRPLVARVAPAGPTVRRT